VSPATTPAATPAFALALLRCPGLGPEQGN
jgi:hypothetical protein